MATAFLEKENYSPDDLLEITDGHRYELVDGHLVERDIGAISSWVGAELYGLLRDYCRVHHYGWVWVADAGFNCFQRKTVRYPDVAVVRYGRLPGERLPKGHIEIAPDFVAEVISPHDKIDEMEEKVRDYRDAGVRLIWLIYPTLGIARVHRPDRTITEVTENEWLDGESVLPGFRVRLGDLFPQSPEPNPPADVPTSDE